MIGEPARPPSAARIPFDDAALRQPFPGEEARPFPDPGRHLPLQRCATAWCWRSAPRPTSSPSSCGTGGGSGSTACRAPSTSSVASRTSSGNGTSVGARKHLVNRIEPIAAGDGWREERTGLHELEFIETRRHWFTGTVAHDTGGGGQCAQPGRGPRGDRREPDRGVCAVRRPLCRNLHHSRRRRPLHDPPARRGRRHGMRHLESLRKNLNHPSP